jgi:hypothetical protein
LSGGRISLTVRTFFDKVDTHYAVIARLDRAIK